MGNTNGQFPEGAKGHLGIVDIVVVGIYMKSSVDVITLMAVTKKFYRFTEAYKYNVVPVLSKKLFPAMEKQFLYSDKDEIIESVPKQVVTYPVTYSDFSNCDDEKLIFMKIKYTADDSKDFGEDIPEDVNVLSNCFDKKIKTIEIPQQIGSVEESALSGLTRLTRVDLGNIFVLPPRCFFGCKALKEIDLSNVVSLGASCFAQCTSLSKVTLCDELRHIGRGCFSFCKSLSTFESENLKEIHSKVPLWLSKIFNKSGITCSQVEFSLEDKDRYGNEIPEGVVHISSGCFEQSNFLKEIVIPNTVTSIGESAFGFCGMLSKVVLPQTIKSLPQKCFRYDYSITCIEIPTTITHIGEECFLDCCNIKEISLEKGVQLDKYAFSNCLRLTDLPEQVTMIKNE
ncbi:hypothetical protein EIN_371750 [Entamoeba invadens IP1]|uniref:Leucine rich repeat containing protein BspA family protein n=1 Tax=Entamoeba invadens IP1 TaxID=370355 RepID=A0A0A1UC96_ENTIV|nr:hypothetical protein EIN_371750 [Entamoeba invadens IP1]ELP92763.1 hypothetical protein EIN_371750 [Entamoeba invadens IP1]|eukprot:XP_004259534.1 hypothetical protein EIN_371750 [Entamoeba invadens IP1]